MFLLTISQKSCRSSCLESQIINIKFKKNQQKVPGPPTKLSASDLANLWEFPTLNKSELDEVLAWC